MARHLDLTIGSPVKRDEWDLNYNLYNGTGAKIPAALYEWCKKEVRILDNTFDIGYDKILHHDIISIPLKKLVGEQGKRVLRPIVIDASERAFNFYKNEIDRGVKTFLQERFVSPLRDQITKRYLMENQIEDPYSLSVQEQQQMKADIDQRMESEMPTDFNRYLKTKVTSPSSIKLSRLLDVYIREQRMKMKYDECFKNLLCTGVEAIYHGVENNREVARVCNPKNLVFDDSDDCPTVEDGFFAKYTEQLNLVEICSRHRMTTKLLDKIKDLIVVGRTGHDGFNESVYSNFIAFASRDEWGRINFDMRSRDGQRKLVNMLGKYYDPNMFKLHVGRSHFVWKALRGLNYVRKLMPNGSVEGFWRDENYMRGPEDISVEKFLVPELYQATLLGDDTENSLWLDKGPVPYQRVNIHNPFDCKLNYIGVRYNKFYNSSEFTAPIDLVKNDQYKYNVEMMNLHLMEATDLGKIFVTSPDSIPDEMDPKEFYMGMKYSKTAMIKTRNENGLVDPSTQYMNKAIDLSNDDKIANQLAYLKHIEDRASMRLGIPPARRGESGQYTSANVNQQNLINATDQTAEMFLLHDNFIESSLNYAMSMSQRYIEENPVRRLQILDDYSTAAIEVDHDSISDSNPAVFIVNSAADQAKMDLIKNVLLPMASQNMEWPYVINMIDSDNMSEIRSFTDKAYQDVQQRAAIAAQKEQERLQFEYELKGQLEETKGRIKQLQSKQDSLVNILLAQINAERFAKQWDINRDQINDNYERAILDNKTKLEIADKQVKSNEKIAQMKTEVDKMKAKQPAKS